MGSSTPTPWARGDASMRQVVKSQQNRTAQQGRQTVDVTKPNVFSSDGGDLIIPGRREFPTNAGKVLTVNADEDAYELTTPPSGGGSSSMTMAYVYTDSTSVSGNTMTFNTYDLQDDNVPWTGTGTPVTPTLNVLASGIYYGPDTDGFYGLGLNVSLNLGGTPGAAPEVFLNGTATGSARLAAWQKWFPQPLVQYHDLYYDLGPFYYSPTALTHPAFSVAVRVSGGFPGTPSGSVNAWITRLG